MHWQKPLRTMSATWSNKGRMLNVRRSFVRRKYNLFSLNEFTPCRGSRRTENGWSEIWWLTARLGHRDSQERPSSGCARSWTAGPTSLRSITRTLRFSLNFLSVGGDICLPPSSRLHSSPLNCSSCNSKTPKGSSKVFKLSALPMSTTQDTITPAFVRF